DHPRADEVSMALDERLRKARLSDDVYGIRRMTVWLRQQGHAINHKSVGHLLRRMGLEAVYPKQRLNSLRRLCSTTRRYPYLPRDQVVKRPNQVWSTDSNYVRMWRCFVTNQPHLQSRRSIVA